LTSSSLTLALIDPNGLDFSFDALQTLTDDRRVDLIYLFPDGMDVRRNLERFLEADARLDNVLGTTEWRERMKDQLKQYPMLDETGICPGATTLILRTFKDQLAKLGYVEVLSGEEIRFKNRKQAPLYKLVFASKHPRGHEFWKKIQTIEAWGQRKMFS
jgi:three-Cys-motif partner protein